MVIPQITTLGGHQPGCMRSVGGCPAGSALSSSSSVSSKAWRRVSVSTVQYWIGRYRSADESDRASGGWAEDHPCTPHHQPGLSSPELHDRVCEERRRTGWGPRLIASELGLAHATVSRCLMRRGLSRRPVTPKECDEGGPLRWHALVVTEDRPGRRPRTSCCMLGWISVASVSTSV